MSSGNNSNNTVGPGPAPGGGAAAARGKTQSMAASFDHYMKESTRSFKECSIKNSARRNSLQKKTLGIERERKISSSQLDKKERVLRQKYHQLQADQKCCSSSHCLQDGKGKEEEEERLKKEREKEKRLQQGRGEDDVVVNPYPITFRPKTVNPMDKKARNKPAAETVGSALCRRRMSSEFEDLILNTRTGNLQLPGSRTTKLALSPMVIPSKASPGSRPNVGVTTIRENSGVRRVGRWPRTQE